MIHTSDNQSTRQIDELEAAYEAATSDAMVLKLGTPDMIRLRGVDRLDLLHRISTNDLIDLSPGEFRATILTNANARILDVVQVLQRRDDTLVLAHSNLGKKVQDWLDAHIFFQDDVQTELLDNLNYRLWAVYGPKSEEVARKAVPWMSAVKESAYQFQDDSFVIPTHTLRLPGFHFLSSNNDLLDPSWDEDKQIPRMEAYQANRIEAGQPEIGREITEDRIPLEIGLDDLISSSKGCYIGQEIIARMESRNRLARQMLGVQLSRPTSEGSPIYQDGAQMGILTSSGYSPKFGNIGLVIAKTKDLDLAAPIIIEEHEATLTHLPFQ